MMEAGFRTLKAEWLDIYDKLYRLAGRMDAGRRWEGQKAASPPNNGGEVVPPDESQRVLPAPAENTAPPTAKISRAELMRSMTG